MIRGLVRMITVFIIILSVAGASWAGGVVVVLSGGGTRGLAHIGALKVLEENNIPVRAIVGTSMGSIMGGLYACGYSADEIDRMLKEIDFEGLFYDRSKSSLLPPGEEAAGQGQSFYRIQLNDEGRVVGPLGGLTGKRLYEKLLSLTAVAPVADFDDLPIPFAAVATDLVSGEPVVLRGGCLASAMRASMSIPGFFEPWTINGRLLVDGGLVANAPVLIAKELYPGYPVVAVNVTGGEKKREQIHTVVDVMDQMVAIMTRQNVEQELKAADVVIHPMVDGLPMISGKNHDKIIEAGREAAQSVAARIAALAEGAAPVPARSPSAPPRVSSVVIRGLGPEATGESLERYGYLRDKVLDIGGISEACSEIRERDDVKNVNFFLLDQPDGSVTVVFDVEKRPAWEILAGGYVTNLDPYIWVYLDTYRRDLWDEGDLLRMGLEIGERWGFSLRYLTPVDEDVRRYGAYVSARKHEYEPAGSGSITWETYDAGIDFYRSWGPFRATIGYAFERVDWNGEHDFIGPSLSLSYNSLDDAIDPTQGLSFRMSAWWREHDTLLARCRFLGVTSFGESWRVFLKGGAIAGDVSRPYHAALLGGEEELYSRANHPLMAENAAWLSLALRRVFFKSWWGTVNVDLFGTAGQTYDNAWDRTDDVWEAGLALSIPGQMFDGRIIVAYDDQDEWTFGFTLGRPQWRWDPIPGE